MKHTIERILKKAAGKKAKFEVFVPEREEFGHYSTNAALKLAKVEKKNPLEIAGQIVAKIEKTAPRGFFEKIEIASPGFINFRLSSATLQKELKEIVESDARYGKSDVLKNKKIIVEFTDANPFKEFHIGHLYSNIVGESLARLFEASGANVKRANYQGDVGLHVAKAVWGMRQKMEASKLTLAALERKNLQERIRFMGQAYALGATAFKENETAKREMNELNKKIYALNSEIKALYQKGRRWSLEYFETIYRRLGTTFDFYYFEREIGEVGLALVNENVKRGIFEESEGAVVFPGEKYGLHKRVFVNSQGLPTYEAKELGLAPIKYKDFPYDISIIVTGNEIIDYFKVLVAALKKINPKLGEKTKHIAHGMVRLTEGKMSSRTGNVITGTQLLDEMKTRVLKIMKSSKRKFSGKELDTIAEAIAVGAVKYSFLKVGLGQDIVFDFDASLNLKRDSGPYLQYTYARLKSILRKAGKVSSIKYQVSSKKTAASLNEEQELRLVRKLIEFPETVGSAAENYAPNNLATYLYKLSELANHYYESTPILKDKNRDRRNARLVLVEIVAAVLKNGLGLLGIKTPEKI